MDTLAELKDAILRRRETGQLVEACYREFLEEYSLERATVFANLLDMLEETPRTREIVKVMDLVKFPVKKSISAALQ